MENKYRKYKQKYISSQMNKFGGGEESVPKLPPGAIKELEALKLEIEKINEELTKVLNETKNMTPEMLQAFQDNLAVIQIKHSNALKILKERLEYWKSQTISNEERMSLKDYLIKLQDHKLKKEKGLEEHKEGV